jgi:hypothetical protein
MTIYEDWSEQLTPWMTDDLDTFVAAISSMWESVEVFIEDDPDNDIVAWQTLFDVDIAPLIALPWLAQTVGERLPVGLDEEAARNWIRLSPNWSRGTPGGIVDAVKRHLTGAQTVMFAERSLLDGTPDDDTISIATYLEETPDQTVILDTLRKFVPADILFEYEAISQSTWAIVEAGQDDWAELETTYGPTWSQVAGAKPGFNVWQ